MRSFCVASEFSLRGSSMKWFSFWKPRRRLSLNGKQERLLERLRNPAQKTGGVRAVNQTMVVGERERQDEPRLELSTNPFRLHARPRKSKNRNLGMIHNRSKRRATDAAEVGDGEGAAFHVSEG